VTTGLVVVGFDGSEGAQHAVDWAAHEAAALGASPCIVHAVGLLEHAGLGGVADGEVAMKLAQAAGLARARVQWRVEDGDPCTALLRVAEETGAAEDTAMLVVGSRGAGAHAGTLLGSTSLELAERATVPVTIVPPPH